MKLKQVLALPVGMIFLAMALLIQKFLPPSSFHDFLEGLFTGMSIVLNIYYIFVIANNKDKKVKL